MTAAQSRRAVLSFFVLVLTLGSMRAVQAHPLGNFTINHYARIEIGDNGLRLRYVVDMAEIPTFQALQKMGRADAQGPSPADLSAYARQAAAEYARNIALTVDGVSLPLTPISASAVTKPGSGGLPILDVTCDLAAPPIPGGAGAIHRLRFDDQNSPDRIGWREIVVRPAKDFSVFNSSAYGNAVTDELKAYPQDMIAAPLSEQTAALSWTHGAAPPSTAALRTRDGRRIVPAVRDPFTDLISVRTLTPTALLLGILFAFFWGAGHAFSPGHGKTVVGAYLVGSRGTARHAVFLGTTVTITHTLGVFALGLVTLFAAQSIVPDRLYPILTILSGGMVALIGLSLLVQRLSVLRGIPFHDHNPAHDHDYPHTHDHDHDHAHDQAHRHTHDHDHAHDHTQTGMHSHGGVMHSHLPPGADGSSVTWRSLLALGVSGGLLPCPSALLVLLAAVSLHRVAYGLVLVFAFSIGLAATLTGIGLAFVYGGRHLSRLAERRVGAIGKLVRMLPAGRLVRVLPVASALVISLVGIAICGGAVQSLGLLGRASPPQTSFSAGLLSAGSGQKVKHD